MVEYLIILPSLLLLVLGAIQFGLLYQIKSQVNYAIFAAARQGALKNGSSNAIKDAFGAGMSPLFAHKPDIEGMMRGRAVGAIEAFNPLVTTITRISPPDTVKDDFGIDDPADNTAMIVPNDNLVYRSMTAGGNSGLNIQDANLLKIRVTYCAKLIVPVANVVFYSLVNGIQGLKNLGGEMFSTPQNTATTPNSCSQLKDRVGDKIETLASLPVLGAAAGPIQDAVDAVSAAHASFSIPGINWGIGGYRIPVTAEAVVRMQTPMKYKK
jgi:hypothetical protein